MKHIIAVHDLSGYGRCSLTVVLPTLAAMGVRAYPLLTAYLSAQTAFPTGNRAVFLDLTDQMEQVLDHWKYLNAQFDGFYSGFLGSPAQMDILQSCLAKFRHPGFLTLVDPVMGDNGKPYRTYTPELCARMGELAAQADVITPNLTEAAILLGEPYDPDPSPRKAEEWLRRLSLDSRRSVILTGLSPAPGTLGAGCFDRATGLVHTAQAPLAQGRFSGTGDLFASVALGRLLAGHDLPDATHTAVAFVARAAQATVDRGGDPLEGADFEPLLGLLTQPEAAHPLGLEGGEV